VVVALVDEAFVVKKLVDVAFVAVALLKLPLDALKFVVKKLVVVALSITPLTE